MSFIEVPFIKSVYFIIGSSAVSLYVVVPVTILSSCIALFICNLLIVTLVMLRKSKRKRWMIRIRNSGNQDTTNNIQNGNDMGFPQPFSPYSSTSMEPVHVSVSNETSISCTSGSGAGMPFLVKRTIARSIKIGESIGGGKFGQVYLGYYQGERYAVKKFFSKDEQSWFHESDIYNTVNLRHENILTCFATDMLSNNGVTELWLITRYYSRGSLFEELNRNPLSIETMLKLLLSACSGLTYLHTELAGTQGKPSIAHRDIKSKNILVKNDDTCCIADFGLAIVDDNTFSTFNKPGTVRQGTKRYMSPEILAETLNIENFGSFLRSDMYSFGLVLWEVSRRCIIEGNER